MTKTTRKWALIGVQALAAGLLTMLATGEAHAFFKVCNKTSREITYSHTIADTVGCPATNPWRNRGWWRIAPNSCATISSSLNMLDRRYYYYAASTDGALEWTSSNFVWNVRQDAHNYCMGAVFVCGRDPVTGQVWECDFEFRSHGHREKRSTVVDHTLNLVE